ncbi:f7a5f13b-fdbf-475e-8b78-75e2118f2d1f [Thermothielavioides terrestris]|uniref:F7a5f13b-fdbf-475e-8b78-75e2118f2d1f n=1 Tax=Thermothielavioides terrestris TaxID=2587410 RepID=A0A446BLK9_9PEZI|nr:f7a5f13b-fdbf-475e-8b78-75e2118f2d1f [Thermothielavioides terrestris]
MAGYLIHLYATGENAFALVCGLFTAIVVGYDLITEKVPSARVAYNIWAVLALDLLMAIFWLASLGANAALRATFKYSVTIDGCYDDGSVVSSNHCVVSKRAAVKRAAVANAGGLAMISAIAGLSALPWLLFIATLVFHGHTFRLWHQEHKKPSADNATAEMKAQGTPMLAPQAPDQAVVHPQYADMQPYQSQVYPPQQLPQQAAAVYQQQPPPAGYPEAPAAYPQQQPYAPYADPNQAQYPPQQPVVPSPLGTPAPGQPYYPPQQ